MPVLRLKTPVMPSCDQSPLGSCILLKRSNKKGKRETPRQDDLHTPLIQQISTVAVYGVIFMLLAATVVAAVVVVVEEYRHVVVVVINTFYSNTATCGVGTPF